MTDQVNGVELPETMDTSTIELLIDRVRRVTAATMPEAVIVLGILDTKSGAIATLINGDERHILGVTNALQFIIPQEMQRNKSEATESTVQ